MTAVDEGWDAIDAERDMQRAIKAWLGPQGTGRYIVSRTIPTTTLDGAPLLGYVYDGVLYVHPDRSTLARAVADSVEDGGLALTIDARALRDALAAADGAR